MFSQFESSNQIVLQAKETIHIPKEFYGAIKGKGSTKQRDLEEQTATKLMFPPPSSQDEHISIEGTREGIAHAKHRLEIIVAELAKKATEKFSVPKVSQFYLVTAARLKQSVAILRCTCFFYSCEAVS